MSGQFLQESTPKIEESLRVFQEKLLVAIHLRNSIASITINSNRLRQIAGSPDKLVSILFNEVKGTTRNEHNNFVIVFLTRVGLCASQIICGLA